jgi:hypothetical protein
MQESSNKKMIQMCKKLSISAKDKPGLAGYNQDIHKMTVQEERIWKN